MVRHHPEEFIGSELRVLQAKNRDLKGLRGRIINETRSTFGILTDHEEERTVLKQGGLFLIGNTEVIGADILLKPEERIKTRK